MADFDFDFGILDEVAHRPWPLPRAPWIMTQTWSDLLFAHWPVEPAVMAPLIPAGLDLDRFDGQAWIGVVPFRMTNVAPRVLPAMPSASAFPELNVRTYVRLARGAGVADTTASRPGVYFFSLDAASALAVIGARTLFHLPYYLASMRVDTSGDAVQYDSRRRALWPRAAACRRSPAVLRATYAPMGPSFQPQPGTLEYFLTERYCLHAARRDRQIVTVDIHHPPWSLQPARATFDANGMTAAAGIVVRGDVAPLLHFAKRQDAVAWPPKRLVKP